MSVTGFRLLPTPAGPVLRVAMAATLLARVRGLLGVPRLNPGEALLLCSCSAIRTFGLRFPIDVVWLDPHYRVLRVDAAVPAGQVRVCRGARAAPELAAGQAAALGLQRGVQLALDP